MDKRLQAVPELFPPPLRDAVRGLLAERGSRVEELRLRSGCQPSWVTVGRELPFPDPRLPPASPELLEEIVRRASGNAVYAVQEQLCRGYLSLPGGHRLGLCGTASTEDGTVKTIRGYQALALRIAGERTGCADLLFSFVRSCPGSTLILGPPGAGKTTVLRDLIRQVSDGWMRRVGLVDERGELAACTNGVPQLDVGKHTDVLSGFPKTAGIELLLRTMAPEWIALDEISAAEDVEAMDRAAYCGVRFFATAHAEKITDLRARPLYRRLLETGVFENVAMIRRDRSVICERMKDGLLQAGRGGADSCRLSVGGLSRRPATASDA